MRRQNKLANLRADGVGAVTEGVLRALHLLGLLARPPLVVAEKWRRVAHAQAETGSDGVARTSWSHLLGLHGLQVRQLLLRRERLLVRIVRALPVLRRVAPVLLVARRVRRRGQRLTRLA